MSDTRSNTAYPAITRWRYARTRSHSVYITCIVIDTFPTNPDASHTFCRLHLPLPPIPCPVAPARTTSCTTRRASSNTLLSSSPLRPSSSNSLLSLIILDEALFWTVTFDARTLVGFRYQCISTYFSCSGHSSSCSCVLWASRARIILVVTLLIVRFRAS